VAATMSLRQQHLDALKTRAFDCLIIGGGINGAVSAAALAAHGARVALIDRGDFGGLTSQESSNLIWGGIKYLENWEVPLVWDLCASRNRLRAAYPTNVREIRFFASIEPTFRWPPLAMFAGTWVYWFIGRCAMQPPRLLSRAQIALEEPVVRGERFRGGVEYSDAHLVEGDARFVFGFVRAALARGAVCTNYVELIGAARGADGAWRVTLRDRETGERCAARAGILINAAGPYVDAVNEQLGVRCAHRHVFSQGIHLVVDRLTDSDRVLTFFDDTGRMFFVVPLGHRSVIGTTDTAVERPQCAVTDEARRFLLANANNRLQLKRPLTRNDVIAERCGVRPLVIAAAAHRPVRTIGYRCRANM